MFRRRRNEDAVDERAEGATSTDERTDDVEAADTEQDAAQQPEAEASAGLGLPPAPRPDGPWDVAELDDPTEGRVDLGGMLVPGVENMELRVEVAGDAIVAATVVLGPSAVQLQAFAAPRSEGLWTEIRDEIASGITQQGGVVNEVEGPLGWELRAQVPVQLPDGNNGMQQVRFVGCDGPRWFLRGVISGQGAAQPDNAAVLEQVFQATAVVRGEEPMAPRDPLVLKLPEDAQMVPEADQAASEAAEPTQSRFSGQAMNPLQRGPEITEVR